MSSKRFARTCAMAPLLIAILTLAACGKPCDDSHPAVVQPDCMPVAGSRSAQAAPSPDPFLQDPSLYDITWTCPGDLFVWNGKAFQPFPRQHPLCRFATNASRQTVEYHRKPRRGPCRSGALVFKTRPDDGDRWYWYDPALRFWLAMNDQYLVTLRGDTGSDAGYNGWKPVTVDSATGGEFFDGVNRSHLVAHNRIHRLGYPGSFPLLLKRIDLWMPPAGQHGWKDISHARVCNEIYSARLCPPPDH